MRFDRKLVSNWVLFHRLYTLGIEYYNSYMIECVVPTLNNFRVVRMSSEIIFVFFPSSTNKTHSLEVWRSEHFVYNIDKDIQQPENVLNIEH